MSKATINPVAPLTQRDGRRDLEITERLHELDQVLRKCLSYLADLNGCNWIEGDHPAHADMRQRAKALQQVAIDALGVRSLSGPAQTEAPAVRKTRPVVVFRPWEKRGHGGQQTKYAVSIECGNVFGSGDVSIFPMLHAGYGSTADISGRDDARKHAEKVAVALGLEVVEG